MAEILVVGATGKSGGRVSAQLAARGASVRAASRTPAPATANVTPIPFDWDDSATYQPALDGVDGVYFVPPSLRTDYPPLVDAFLEAVTAAASNGSCTSAPGAPWPATTFPCGRPRCHSRRPACPPPSSVPPGSPRTSRKAS